MCEGLKPRWEELGRIDVRCRVCTEVEKELEESENDDEGDCTERVELAGEDTEKQSTHQEALDLDPFAAKPFDREC